jgi:hypothetical protein
VVPSLVYREGRLRNRVVKWDGVVRRLPTEGEGENPIPESFDSMVPVVSLHVAVFDGGGEPLFENFGGVDLAHVFSFVPGDEGGLRLALRVPMLGERRFLREGVEVAFDPYLRSKDAGDW